MTDDKKRFLLRCDLQSEYDIDLDDLFKKKLSWARVAELTAGLPPGSRIHEGWGQQTHFLADQVDLLNRIMWLQQIATTVALDKKDRKILKKPPKLLERPGVEHRKEKPVFTDTKDVIKMLGKKPGPSEEELKAIRQAQAIHALRSLAI